MERMELRVDAATKRRLDALARKLELRRPDLVRQAIKRMAEAEGLERHTES